MRIVFHATISIDTRKHFVIVLFKFHTVFLSPMNAFVAFFLEIHIYPWISGIPGSTDMPEMPGIPGP